MFDEFVQFTKTIYGDEKVIPLHRPKFCGNEQQYLLDCLHSTYVSSIGEYVTKFEKSVADFTRAKHSIATVNGTAALQISLIISGVEPSTEVITQSMSFVATGNSIRHCGAVPVFVDIDLETLSLCPQSMLSFLEANCELRNDGKCWNFKTNRRVAACLPMHTFGFPAQISEISELCDQYNIPLVEDAAEALGSTYETKHVGVYGDAAALSFNGNKIITTGGGGMVLTNDDHKAKWARHISTTAKIPHQWEFYHDQVGFNYRMPNINAAIGLAQMEALHDYVKSKRALAREYQSWGSRHGVQFLSENSKSEANYWLNSIMLGSRQERNRFLEHTNNCGVLTRPAWTPMHLLPFNVDSPKADLTNTQFCFDRIINVPSSVPL